MCGDWIKTDGRVEWFRASKIGSLLKSIAEHEPRINAVIYRQQYDDTVGNILFVFLPVYLLMCEFNPYCHQLPATAQQPFCCITFNEIYAQSDYNTNFRLLEQGWWRIEHGCTGKYSIHPLVPFQSMINPTEPLKAPNTVHYYKGSPSHSALMIPQLH